MYIEMIDHTQVVPQALLDQTREILSLAAKTLGKPAETEMQVTFVDDQESHELNLRYRDTDRATDVISLEYKPEAIQFDTLDLDDDERAQFEAELLDPYIGELFINIDRAKAQAQAYGHSFEREMGFLAVHGFLHINGYDHYTPSEEAEMFAQQEEILQAYGLKRD